MLLRIEHESTYRYARPLRLGPHRLMIRPIDGHDVQIRSSELSIQPAHRIRWMHDVFGNSIATLDFTGPAAELRVSSAVVVEQFNTNPFDFVLDAAALELPFAYDPSEARDVAPYLEIDDPRSRQAVKRWVQPFLDIKGRAKTVEFLTKLNRSFPLYFQYTRREEAGVQTPGETLKLRAGSCRDFALLLMEAARHLGLAARFVSGYLCHATGQPSQAACNATHAWAEIYLPGAGWKGFDPTTGTLAADMHVRVAAARQPSQATPIRGTFDGKERDFLGMTVTVDARVMGEPNATGAPA